MRLSRLHINGFKSFPDRAELGFDHGVTAIVGPNGCGKSNVVDAITWVLGEQSAKSLRGERMEDVIFNGSDARKPTGAAEVRLKLKDVAQAAMRSAAGPDALLDETPLVTRDVEIGRRLYRSGESEYLIDGEICRLRDVHDLLMDSGLGVKAYAVIEQGKIGQILSSRPAERRMLIEEAAGVTRYKSRRRAAELKLEAAQQNLTRIDDIVFEVEKQRGALRRQAARARRYRALREEMRRWEQVLFARRYEALSREIESAESRLGEVRAREAASAGRLAELESTLEALRLEVGEAESSATGAREAAHQLELEIGRRQQQIQFDRQQIDELGRQEAAFRAEAAELEARRAPGREAIDNQRRAATAARQALAETARTVALREEAYGHGVAVVQDTEHGADHARGTVLTATATLSALRQARASADAARERVATERSRLDIEARDLDRERQSTHEAHVRARQSAEDARRRLEAAAQARVEAEAALTRLRADREALGQAVTERQREQAHQEARWRSLQDLLTTRATFGDAARLLLDAGTISHAGAVADHLEVAHSYERAVDALLGDLLQHVLVADRAAADQAFALVAARQAGRCGLVVLDANPPPSAPAGGSDSGPAGARTLRSVVRATGPHAAILSALLGEALIVDSLDEAQALAPTVGVPVATRAGAICQGPWRIEGGARREAHGILETRAEAALLADRVAQGAEALRRLEQEASDLDVAVQAGDAALAGRVEDHHREEKTIVALEAELSRLETDLGRLGLRLDVVTTEHRRTTDEEHSAIARHEEAGRAIESREQDLQGAEAVLAGVLVRLQQAREAAEAAVHLVTDARAEQAALIERAAALEAETVRLEEAAHELEVRLAVRHEEITRAEGRRDGLRAAIRETEHALDRDVTALDARRADVMRADEQVVALRARFSDKEHDIRTARHHLEAVRAEVHEVEVLRARAASDLTHLTATCFEAVNLTLDEVVAAVTRMEAAGELTVASARAAAPAAEGEDDLDEGQGETVAGPVEPEGAETSADAVIARLKRKLERLGPVNMMAIEQFDELETRHTFLTTQRKDLLDSIAQTGEAIERIDKTTRERFEEAFVSINRHFETTFTTLFGGGRAGLVLIDQEDEAESGIDIIAQPPGKRLQNVQLLSGGEKALTAMALMFAIFKHRPSPFCLLDEIDAPLDDANIGRFVDMLQGMQAHTQFILITHNRRTMEIADRLYGVTMEEPGVSKLISVEMH